MLCIQLLLSLVKNILAVCGMLLLITILQRSISLLSNVQKHSLWQLVTFVMIVTHYTLRAM